MNAATAQTFGLFDAPKLNITVNQAKLGWAVVMLLTSIVLFVSINDVYWSFKTQDSLLQNERNPIGRWLIRMDNGDIALFMTAKMVGSMIVVTMLPLIYWIRQRIGLIVSGSLAIFQTMLFLQLNLHIPLLAWI